MYVLKLPSAPAMPYGVRIMMNGSGPAWALGMKMRVWSPTPSRAGIQDLGHREAVRWGRLGADSDGSEKEREGECRAESHKCTGVGRVEVHVVGLAIIDWSEARI
jgi:hypothetical protein